MKVDEKTFTDRYSQMETDDLLSLCNSGGLTPEAFSDLESVLRSRGVEPPGNTTHQADQGEENALGGWRSFWLRFLSAFAICLLASRVFLSHLPNPANVFPGSVRDIVGRLVGDSAQFLVVFAVISLMTVVFSRLRRNTRKSSVPRLLAKAVTVTIFVEVLLIFGGWYATSR